MEIGNHVCSFWICINAAPVGDCSVGVEGLKGGFI